MLCAMTLFLVGCDHATKLAAQGRLSGGGAVQVIPGAVELRYAENRDTAFSVTRDLRFAGKPAVLAALAGATLLAFVLWLRRRLASSSAVELAASACVLAGALGNLLDRALRGYVIDFVYVHHWPIFNVADVLVGVGAGALLLASRARGPAAAA